MGSHVVVVFTHVLSRNHTHCCWPYTFDFGCPPWLHILVAELYTLVCGSITYSVLPDRSYHIQLSVGVTWDHSLMLAEEFLFASGLSSKLPVAFHSMTHCNLVQIIFLQIRSVIYWSDS